LYLQVLPDHADQEERHDVGQYDRNDPAGRSASYIELQKGKRIDEIGEVGAFISRPAICRDQDFGKDA
jgi:hypothetical protein